MADVAFDASDKRVDGLEPRPRCIWIVQTMGLADLALEALGSRTRTLQGEQRRRSKWLRSIDEDFSLWTAGHI